MSRNTWTKLKLNLNYKKIFVNKFSLFLLFPFKETDLLYFVGYMHDLNVALCSLKISKSKKVYISQIVLFREKFKLNFPSQFQGYRSCNITQQKVCFFNVFSLRFTILLLTVIFLLLLLVFFFFVVFFLQG